MHHLLERSGGFLNVIHPASGEGKIRTRAISFQNACVDSLLNCLLRSPGYLGWALSTHTGGSGDTSLESWEYGVCQRLGLGQIIFLAFSWRKMMEKWGSVGPVWDFQGWFVPITTFLGS